MRCDLDFWEQFAATFTDPWREFAACIDTPEHVFLDPEYEDQAQRFCDQCPVWRDCLDDAIYYDDGGHRAMSEKERSSIIMHRKRNIKAFHYDLGLLDE
jgi:hypothetical protein